MTAVFQNYCEAWTAFTNTLNAGGNVRLTETDKGFEVTFSYLGDIPNRQSTRELFEKLGQING